MFRVRWLGRMGCCAALLVCCLLLPAGGPATADETLNRPVGPAAGIDYLSPGHCPRVADPKLHGGSIPLSFRLHQDLRDLEYQVRVTVVRGGQLVRRLLNMRLPGANRPVNLLWDGRDEAGRLVDPGEYLILVQAELSGTIHLLIYPISIVRLGFTEIEAREADSDEEWQMVYFRKGDQYDWFATPAIHEYLNIARNGEVSDLDLNSGEPRPAAPLHTATASPVLDGPSAYDTSCYNYPLCYLVGSRPRFQVTMGDSCTLADGSAGWCGYPIAGVQIRVVAQDQEGVWEGDVFGIRPGGQYLLDGPDLPARAGRTERTVTWRWQYRELLGSWEEIPGALVTRHRFYTIVDQPYWPSGAGGTQYAGPWVEVAEYLHLFAETLKINVTGQADVVRAFVRGYFGQEGPLTGAIEGVVYDCYSMGGDGGATHYYSFSGDSVQLSRLLNSHANGVYVNCSDVAASSSVMLGMLGVQDVRMVYLGTMYLRAIWGVGCPGYTLDLWSGAHGFSYHHIITRDGGDHVSDACMWLDEDGNPDALPGTPGYNTDRPWSGPDGYNELSASNNVSKSLDTLPDVH